MLNIKVRLKNMSFWLSLGIAFFTPILAYMGISVHEVNTWSQLGNIIIAALQNPYVILLILESVYNALIDPTTKGIKDSKRALNYSKPSDK